MGRSGIEPRQGWGKVKQGSRHAGVSERTFRPWFKVGLRHIRLPSGTILVKYSWIDDFLQQYEVTENRVDQVVTEVLENLAK